MTEVPGLIRRVIFTHCKLVPVIFRQLKGGIADSGLCCPEFAFFWLITNFPVQDTG